MKPITCVGACLDRSPYEVFTQEESATKNFFFQKVDFATEILQVVRNDHVIH